MDQRLAGQDMPSAMPAEFDAFIRQHRPTLVSYLRRRVSSEDDVQDIVQESLIRLMRYGEREPDAWGPLLYRIAINIRNDRLRRTRVRKDIQYVSLDESAHEVASPEPGHVQRINTQQELDRLRKTLLRLPERCRQIYLLNRIEGMTYPEIAAHLEIGVKAVEKQMSKALAKLRQSLNTGE